MSGTKKNDAAGKKARQERVLELIDQGFRFVTIAKRLEVSVKTIERDWDEMKGELIQKMKEDATGYAKRTMQQAENELEILTFQLERARNEHDDVRARRILDQLHRQRMDIAKLRQSFGWAPKEADKVDMVQHIDNPLADMVKDGLGTTRKPVDKSE